ncbi:MAG: BON domain-containing protein [Burkholderiales bacterium]|nr:BON domain-containing protein [Burkholderiales bacterium]
MENVIMGINRKHIVLYAALAGVMVAVTAGCGKTQEATPNPAASTSAGTEIDDTVVTTRVKSALFADPDIKSLDLQVETRKGMVQLSGFVNNQTQIDRALTAARGVAGVTSVENKLSIKDGPVTVGNVVDDSVMTAKVKTALLADPNVKSQDIAVITRKGEVQLSGFVDSQAQIDQAVAIAGKVEGVTSVGNEMSIKK